jgi:hypothetical protein
MGIPWEVRDIITAVIIRESGFYRHCEELSDEAIQLAFALLWIASRSLSSGAHSRDPLARKDGGPQ